MSLLNEMLRDLAKKKRQPQIPGVFIINPQKKIHNGIIDIGVCLVIVIFVHFLLFVLFSNRAYLISQVKQKFSLKPVVEYPAKQVSQAKSALFTSQIETLVSSLAPVPSFNHQSFEDNLPLNSPEEEQPKFEENFSNSPFVSEADQNSQIKTVSELSEGEWAELQLDKAVKAIDSGDDSRGITLLKELIARVPSSLEARESLATMYLSYREYDNALKIINGGLEYEPNSAELIALKAQLLVEQNKAQDALSLLKRYNPDITTHPNYYGVLAAVLESIGRSLEAGSLYQTLVKIDPKNSQYWLGYAIALEQKKSLKQAIEAYKQATNSYNIDIRGYAENRLKILQG